MRIYPDGHNGFTRRIVWGMLLLISGLFAIVFDIGSYRGYQSKSWPVIGGTVVAYYQNPQYRYFVSGVAYENRQVTSLEFVGVSAGNVDAVLAKYPMHGTVMVHYNPKNPQMAVLDTRFESRYYLVSAVISMASIFCALGFLRGWPLYFTISF